MRVTALTFAFAFIGVTVAQGDGAPPVAPCQPKQAMQLDIRTGPQGHVEVPLSINGHTDWFAVDTGGAFSMITYPLAARLKLRLQPFPYGMQLYGGVQLYQAAVADSVTFGKLTASNFGFLAVPQSAFELDMGGVVGIDILRNYDVEIDPAGGKFGFYLPGNCPSPVQSWNNGSYARLPFVMMPEGHILVTLSIEGKPVKAVLDTGSEGASMTLETARRIFGIRYDNPDLKAIRPIAINGQKPTTSYRYPFRSLMFGSLEVKNPEIELIPAEAAGDSPPELLLGQGILREFHIYIAYKQRMIYATRAEAR